MHRLIHGVNKNLEEHGEKLDENTKKEIQTVLDSAKALGSDAEVSVLKEKVSELSSASMKIGQAIYGNAKKDGSEEGSPETKDAEYEEKDKKESNKQ